MLIVDPQVSKEPEIGRWLWALQDTRQRTMRQLAGISQATIDWLPPDNESCIGTILYHIASIENVFQNMDLREFRCTRSLENYDVTPEWVLHHLMQHEAEHRSQIGSLRTRAEA